MQEMGERLRSARTDAGYESAAKAAKALGVNPQTYRAHENGQNEFGPDDALRYGRKFSTDPTWLLLGKGPRIAEPRRLSPDEEYAEEQAELNLLASSTASRAYDPDNFQPIIPGAIPEIDVRLGAGEGAVGEMMALPLGGEAYSGHRIVGEWLFPEAYLRSEIHTSISKTMVIPVQGDSMEPTYRPGDRVLVDRTQQTLTEDTVYVISDGESAPKIKRLVDVMFSKPRKVQIVSDNPAIAPQEALLADVTIIGRVVGVVSRR